MDSEDKRGPGRPRKVVDNDEANGNAPTKMFPVRLLKHYRPGGEYNVISEAPPPFPGGAFKGKLWAGTIVELPADEARRLIDNVHVSREVLRDAQGHPMRDEHDQVRLRERRRKVPLAEIRTEDVIPA